MKIVIDDQYHSDENKQFTVDENGNIDLFINIGEVEQDNNTLEDSNNIIINEADNIVESDFAEFKVNDDKEENTKEENIKEENTKEEVILTGEVIEDVKEPTLNGTISSENPWEDEKFSRDYHSIYAEIENNLEKKYANKDEVYEQESYTPKPMYNVYKEESSKEPKGSITVFSKLGSKDGVEIKGARINIYLLNGVSPKLYDSKFSDEAGKVEFSNLDNGCYRIIAIVDRRFFEKPIYYNWNEVTIDANNKNSNIVVVNRIKPGYYRK